MFDVSTPNGTVGYAPNGDRLTVQGRTSYVDGSVRLHIRRDHRDSGGHVYESMMVYPSTPCYCDSAYHPAGH